MRITGLNPVRRRGLELHIDGELTAIVSREVSTRFGLCPGLEVSPRLLEEILQAEAQHRAMAAALRLLSYQARSEEELRRRLLRRGLDARAVRDTIARLRRMRLLDDAEFSRAFVESRQRWSPRGRRLLVSELLAKQVDPALARQAAASVDEEDAARRAAAPRARAMASLPWPEFRRRLTAFLARRGFDYETALRATVEAWTEATGEAPAADDL
jgi:regulatory protein